jgi:hypothetical protein
VCRWKGRIRRIIIGIDRQMADPSFQISNFKFQIELGRKVGRLSCLIAWVVTRIATSRSASKAPSNFPSRIDPTP